MNDNVSIEDLTKGIAGTVQSNIDLIKFEAVERTSVVGSSIAVLLFVGSFVFLSILFLSLFAGYYLSSFFNDSYVGFALVGGFYLLLSFALILFRKKLIITPVRNKIISSIFKK